MQRDDIQLDYADTNAAKSHGATGGSAMSFMYVMAVVSGIGILTTMILWNPDIGESTDSKFFIGTLVVFAAGWICSIAGIIQYLAASKSKRSRFLLVVFIAFMVLNGLTIAYLGMSAGMG